MSRPTEYHWVFGDNTHIHFPAGGAPVIITAPATHMVTEEGCASISDNSGNLLFYTNGIDQWNASGTQTNPPPANMGGHISATHSAIIVPPAAGGNLYHVFTTYKYNPAGTFRHFLVNANGKVQNGNGDIMMQAHSSERLAATSQKKCAHYWVASQDIDSKQFEVWAVTGDTTPTTKVPSPSDATLDNRIYDPRGQMKFSPDGTKLALAYFHNPKDPKFGNAIGQVSIYDFNNATGVLTRSKVITKLERPWGIEFSANSKNLYFTEHQPSNNLTRIYGVEISQLPAPRTPATDPTIKLVHEETVNNDGVYSALQLGPNDKIYSTVFNRNWLAEIGNPNNLSAPKFEPKFLDASNNKLDFKNKNHSSIPTFTRIADHCLKEPPPDGKGDCCAAALDDMNDELAHDAKAHPNLLNPCDGDPPRAWKCQDAKLPRFEPHISISWGASKCDCLESDDVEIMSITICNPFRNLTMSNFVIPRLKVLNADGSPVATLPDGSPSVRLIPRGPICFGDIKGCQCVTREFVMENRGAANGSNHPYKIEIEEFCYSVSFCNQGHACFEFILCKDN